MRRLILITTLLVLSSTASVMAQSSFYVGASGGAAFFFDQSANVDFLGIENVADVDFEYDTGFQLAGKFGYRLDTNIKLEAEVAYAAADADRVFSFNGQNVTTEQELAVWSVTGGIFFDLWPINVLVPYVGAGLGYAKVAADNTDVNLDLDQNVFTTFAEAGIPYYVTPSISIVPSLRFSWYLTKQKQEQGFTLIGDDLYNTQLQLGLNYHF